MEPISVFCSVVVDVLFIVTPIVGVCNCSMVCCTLRYVPSSFAIILMGKRKLVALLSLSSWCLVIVVWLFLVVPWVCLQFVIVVFPDHTHLLFCRLLNAKYIRSSMWSYIFTVYINTCVPVYVPCMDGRSLMSTMPSSSTLKQAVEP